MISVEEAKRIMGDRVRVLAHEEVPLKDARARVLAADVHAPYPHPLFDMSAVDGYAVGNADGPWSVVVDIAAGDAPDTALKEGQCARIFTGGMVPANTYAVIMQEHCEVGPDGVRTSNTALRPGANIRRRAEQCKVGDLLSATGAILGPSVIGHLASCGVQHVVVSKRPRITIVRTGGEFITETPPEAGRIFSSNDHMLAAALQQAGIPASDTICAKDVREEIRDALLRAAQGSDLVITTGGVSVGDHDLLLPVLTELGATIHFHGIAQKPGKPMLFATLNDVPVFALPGNPRAVIVLYWEYVLPYVRAIQGWRHPWLRSDELPITHSLTTKGERSEFRSARVSNGKVTLLADEGSHMLHSLTEADALAYLPATKRAWSEGETIEVHYLP
ncbi:MAG: molybdopterin molybdotransferase MoeA [Flavobacteriales bacterium]|nr:molybdopterin molybdotransferase MoeA [Flavobacteriales bacterium]